MAFKFKTVFFDDIKIIKIFVHTSYLKKHVHNIKFLCQ